MKWQCALLQRWLPEYPDGDLPGWGKRWLKAHVAQCPACRRELAGLREVVTAIQAAPLGEPEAEFWRDFSREMHLKLAQAAYEGQSVPVPSARRWFRLPYLLGAPVLAVLLLWVAVQLTGPGSPVPNQALVKREAPAKMAAVPKRRRHRRRGWLPYRLERWSNSCRLPWRKARPSRRRMWIFPAGIWIRNWRE